MSTKYEWLSLRDHVLKRPDTFAGGVTPLEMTLVAFVDDRRVDKTINVSPALLKVSDEILVNALDNSRRDSQQKVIEAAFSADGVFEVFNDGKTIPIELWQNTTRYIPEILFGEPMSGENFDDDNARSGGGRNGLGCKIANILGDWFNVELINADDNVIFHATTDALAHCLSRKHPDQAAALACFDDANAVIQKAALTFARAPGGVCDAHTLIRVKNTVYLNVGALAYSQQFEHNLGVVHPPVLSRTSAKKSSTRIRWKVDLSRLGMAAPLSDDVLTVLRARVYDTAAITGKKMTVKLDGVSLKVTCLVDYAKALGGKWLHREWMGGVDGVASLEVCLLEPDESYPAVCVGFVNGLRCSSGTHVEMVFRRLAEATSDLVSKKLKRAVVVKPTQIRERLTVVINAVIVNPSFTTQTKEKLETRADKLVEFACSPAMCRALAGALLESMCHLFVAQDQKAVQKTIKRDKNVCISKYEPALKKNSKQHKCKLYVTEGDSAKALAVAGFGIIGRDHHGVFPLRGKLVNVNGLSAKKALENREIMHLTQILGLDPHRTYSLEAAQALPYANIVIFTDQDHDGSHITGLLLNWLQTFFPSLLEVHPNFVQRFATPIVRARVGAETRWFFSQVECHAWLQGRTPTAIKYYKGLGTSDTEDAKRYFSNIDKHLINVTHKGESCKEAIQTFFNSSRADDRKQRLMQVDDTSFVDYSADATTFTEFCDSELIHHCVNDNRRSLANVIDGLKPSQRKVIFSAFKRKPGEIKVAQMAASTAELTAYHSGESSMVQTLVHLAQPWMGANNVALLKPNGMFGSRHMPRNEHSAERYIFTERHPCARKFFREEDDAVLELAEDDGRSIEPVIYCPIVPFLLINGSEGIGTGWKATCPPYDALEIVENTRKFVRDPNATLAPMTPSYYGFKGTTTLEGNDVVFTGVYAIVDETTIEITELPPKVWTGPYIDWMREHLIGDGDNKFVLKVTDCSTNDGVAIIIKTKPRLQDKNLVKELKLSQRVSLNYLNFFDDAGKLRNYSSIEDIFHAHAATRRRLYAARLTAQIRALEHDQRIAESRALFVQAISLKTIRPTEMNKDELCTYLRTSGYYDHDNFEYMQIGLFSLALDRSAQLRATADKLAKQVDALKRTTVEAVWLLELNELADAIKAYRVEVDAKRNISIVDTNEKKRAKGSNGTTSKGKKMKM